MMSKRAHPVVMFALAALLFAGGATGWLVSEGAISTSSIAAPITDSHSDPAPQRFETAEPQAGTPSALPGGASSLSETYKDWSVACVQQGNRKRCSLSQIQSRQDGQRVLAIEFNTPSGNSVSGTIALPFGLALDAGVSFQIDERPSLPPSRFRTCVPAGCLVTVSFEAPMISAMRSGTVLKVKATADGGAAAPFSVSLQGFGTALDRVAALSR